jgi:hypothetical protein
MGLFAESPRVPFLEKTAEALGRARTSRRTTKQPQVKQEESGFVPQSEVSGATMAAYDLIRVPKLPWRRLEWGKRRARSLIAPARLAFRVRPAPCICGPKELDSLPIACSVKSSIPLFKLSKYAKSSRQMCSSLHSCAEPPDLAHYGGQGESGRFDTSSAGRPRPTFGDNIVHANPTGAINGGDLEPIVG